MGNGRPSNARQSGFAMIEAEKWLLVRRMGEGTDTIRPTSITLSASWRKMARSRACSILKTGVVESIGRANSRQVSVGLNYLFRQIELFSKRRPLKWRVWMFKFLMLK